MAENFIFSDKLPKLRKGSMVCIIEECKRKVIYDDYTRLEESSTAKKWRVRAFDRVTGYELNHILMHNGLYKTLDLAFAEIERFLYRGENIIFYLLPINLKLDRDKLFKNLWPEPYENSGSEILLATDEEVYEEARKRIYLITGKKPDIDSILKHEYIKGPFSGDALDKFNKTAKSYPVKMFPYASALAWSCAILYVSYNKNEWYDERSGMDNGYDGGEDGDISFDGSTSAACVYEPQYDECTFGEILYRYENRNIWRVG